MATMRYDDHKTTAQHNNAAPIRRVDARTHDKTHNKTTPLLLAKRGVHVSSCDYMIHQLSPEYSDTSCYYLYKHTSTTYIMLYVYQYQCVCGSPLGTSTTHLCYLRRAYLFWHFLVVSCHCCVRQEPAAAGHCR